jgi:hypothetical protein
MNTMVLTAMDRKSPIFGVSRQSNVDGTLQGDFWRKPGGCTRKDIHFSHDDKKLSFDEHACWYINHMTLARTGRTPKYMTDALDRAIAGGVKLPLTSIFVRFGVSDGRSFTSMRVHFSPELEGFEPPRNATWSANDWHRDRLQLDPKKIAYIEKIKAWGENWFPKVKAGFQGALGPASVFSVAK